MEVFRETACKSEIFGQLRCCVLNTSVLPGFQGYHYNWMVFLSFFVQYRNFYMKMMQKLKSTSLKEFWSWDYVDTLHVAAVEKCETFSRFICRDSACCHFPLCTHRPLLLLPDIYGQFLLLYVLILINFYFTNMHFSYKYFRV